MDKLLKIDRRIIFVFVALAVTIPLLFRFKMAVPPTRHVISMYDKINALSEGSHVLISFDYDPSSKEELQPMAVALLVRAWQKRQSSKSVKSMERRVEKTTSFWDLRQGVLW